VGQLSDRTRRQQLSQHARQLSALEWVRGRTVDQVQNELLRAFPGELGMGEARMYAHGWTVGVIREGMQALATEEGFDASGLQDADVWRWLRGEVFPRDSLRRLCRLFRCHQAKLGWPPRGADAPIDFCDEEEPGTRSTRFGAAPRRQPLAPPGEATDQGAGGWDVKRRDFVRAGSVGLLVAAFPAVAHWLLASDRERATRTAPNLDTLERYQRVLEECWRLFNLGDVSTAERVVRGLLPAVARHAADRPGAAIVTARGLRLMGAIRQHQLRMEEKMAFCLQAVEYARQSGDATTLVGTLTGLAVGYRYTGQTSNDFATHVEALEHVERAAPLTRSRAYAAIAAAFAQQSRSAEAAGYVQRAHQSFPADPLADPHWLSSDAGIWYVSFHEGRALTALGRPAEAEKAFVSYRQHPTASIIPPRNQLEIENERARAAAIAGDLDLYAACLRSGLEGSLALGSKRRYHEALSIYREHTPPDWRRQPVVARMAEEFNLRGGPPDRGLDRWA
jgi:tetratricopeptide (TPR) repeat protein